MAEGMLIEGFGWKQELWVEPCEASWKGIACFTDNQVPLLGQSVANTPNTPPPTPSYKSTSCVFIHSHNMFVL